MIEPRDGVLAEVRAALDGLAGSGREAGVQVAAPVQGRAAVRTRGRSARAAQPAA
ncbi:hypothetical protein ACFY2R_27555 [Micromonospora olivasterospora]|uniref:hypothetical protein n=1 Tax=Micromonospora olivasterospora TaxID=1880 RepID=UPI001478F4F0|nr:hypothetical protein [Micromonospora olivasterospora]